MSSDDRPGTKVPWDDLSENEKRQFANTLRESGLDLDSREDAEPFYGQKNRVVAELRRRQIPDHNPAHDTHYGIIGWEPETELYGVGEFSPGVVGEGTPVFEAKTENGSYVTFCFPPDDVGDEWLRVFHANSYEEGEFSLLLNRVVQHYSGADDDEGRKVVFTNVVTEFLSGEDLDAKLRGFESRTIEIPEGEPHAGEEIRELVGTWGVE